MLSGCEKSKVSRVVGKCSWGGGNHTTQVLVDVMCAGKAKKGLQGTSAVKLPKQTFHRPL